MTKAAMSHHNSLTVFLYKEEFLRDDVTSGFGVPFGAGRRTAMS